MSVPEDEVDIIGGVGGVNVARQLRLVPDHGVYVKNWDWIEREEEKCENLKKRYPLDFKSFKAAKKIIDTYEPNRVIFPSLYVNNFLYTIVLPLSERIKALYFNFHYPLGS